MVWLPSCPVQRRYRAREGEGGRESGKERQVKKGAAREEQKSRRLRGYCHANTADFLVVYVELPVGMTTKNSEAGSAADFFRCASHFPLRVLSTALKVQGGGEVEGSCLFIAA